MQCNPMLEVVDVSSEQKDVVTMGCSFTRRACGFAMLVLVGGYHADNACAQSRLEGEITDGTVSVSWEYDLNQGRGQIIVTNLGLDLDDNLDEELVVKGLFGLQCFTNVNASPDPRISFDSCVDTTSAVAIAAVVPPLVRAAIAFDIPSNIDESDFALTAIDYGTTTDGDLTSACAIEVMVGSLQNFLTVKSQPFSCP